MCVCVCVCVCVGLCMCVLVCVWCASVCMCVEICLYVCMHTCTVAYVVCFCVYLWYDYILLYYLCKYSLHYYHIYTHTGIQLIVKEYDFTAQPTFSEGDVFNVLPIVKTAIIKVSHHSLVNTLQCDNAVDTD